MVRLYEPGNDSSLWAAEHLARGHGSLNILLIMKDVGSIIFHNLALLFAMGVALGMANKEKEVATLSAAIAFLVMNCTVSTMLSITGGITEAARGAGTIGQVLGIWTLQMGVFGGIVLSSAWQRCTTGL